MKRVLKFDDSKASKDAFAVIYTALMAAEVQARPLAMMRQELATMAALDAVSEPALDGTGNERVHPAGFALRNLVAPVELVLEQPQLELIQQRLDKVSWRTAAVPQVIDVADRLAAAEQRA